MPSLGISFAAVLLTAFHFIWWLWWAVLLAPLERRANRLNAMIFVWVLLAAMRIALLFETNPLLPSLFLPEPLSTILFVITGLALGALKLRRL